MTAQKLEGPGGAFSEFPHTTRMGTEADATRLRHLGDRFEALVQDVRATSGFDRFLLPPSVEMLRAAASRGPVVVLLASKLSCGALILTQATGLNHIPLPYMTPARLSELGLLFEAINSDSRIALDDSRCGIRRSMPKSKGTSHVLAKLWEMVMQWPVVEGLGLKVSVPGQVYRRLETLISVIK